MCIKKTKNNELKIKKFIKEIKKFRNLKMSNDSLTPVKFVKNLKKNGIEQEKN